MSRGAWASVFGESCVAIALSGVTPDWATLATHAQLSIQKLTRLRPDSRPCGVSVGAGLYSRVGGLDFLLLSRVGGLDFLLLQ